MKKLYTFILIIFAFLGVQAQVFVDIDATGANDGTSWSDAFTDFQSALLTNSLDDIWVASGTYYPGDQSGEMFFRFFNSRKVYGGFQGIETTLDERDIVSNEVIFSGDLLGDDTSSSENRSDNAVHIVYIPLNLERCGIDGITFRGETSATK